MRSLLFLVLLLSSAIFSSADDYTPSSDSPASDSPASDSPATDDSPAPEDSKPVPQSSTWVPADPNKKIKVVIEGVVLCQDCSTRGSWSLLNSKPIKNAKVSVTCRDAKNRPTGYQAVQTDDNGYFYCPFDVGSISDYYSCEPTKACFVRLLSSPDQGCNSLTNINWGIVGSPIKFGGKLFCGDDYDTVVFEAAGPLSFRPKWCPITC